MRHARVTLIFILVFGAGGLSARSPGGPPDTPVPAPPPLPEGARLRLGNPGLGIGNFYLAGAISADGAVMAGYVGGRSVGLVDRHSGRPRYVAVGDGQEEPSDLALTPDGRLLAVGGPEHVLLLDASAEQIVRHLEVPKHIRRQSPTFSADGRVLALGLTLSPAESRVFAWDVDTGKPFGPFAVLHSERCAAALSPDGKRLATWAQHDLRGDAGDIPRTLQIWDVSTGRELRRIRLDRKEGGIAAAAFSPDGKTLAVTDGTGPNIYLIDPDHGTEVRRFAGLDWQTSLVRFSPDGRLLVVGSDDGEIQAWETAGGTPLDLAEKPDASLCGVGFTRQGRIIAFGEQYRRAVWWDAATGLVNGGSPGHLLPVVGLAFSPDGTTVRTVAGDGQVLSWDPVAGTLQRRFQLNPGVPSPSFRTDTTVEQVRISPDARFAAGVPANSKGVRLWDLVKDRARCDFGNEWVPAGVAFAGNPRLAIINPSKGIGVWDCRTGTAVGVLKLDPTDDRKWENSGLAVTPDGTRVVTLAWHEDPMGNQAWLDLSVVAVATGKDVLPRAVRLGPGPARPNPDSPPPVAVSPDGKTAAVCDFDGDIALIRVDTGRTAGRLAGGYGHRSCMTFSPDGRTLAVTRVERATAGDANEHCVDVWELASGRRRSVYRGHTQLPDCLGFSPDGRTLAAGDDLTVLLWDVGGTHGKWPRPLSAAELRACWADLAGQDAPTAYAAICRLILAPDEAVALFARELRPAGSGPDAAQVAGWIRDLDDDRFPTRHAASVALAGAGGAVEEPLRAARTKRVSAEVGRRLDHLLRHLENRWLTDNDLRAARAAEVLERIGTPAAVAVLNAWAAGGRGAVLTREARRAVARLSC